MNDPSPAIDFLSGESLMTHVHALADGIGPRPPGHAQEAQARDYVRQALATVGITDIENLAFLTPDTWGYSLIAPLLLALGGNAIPRENRFGKLVGAVTAFVGVNDFWRATVARPQLLFPLYPLRQGGTVLARIAPRGEVRHRVVLIGHTDTNKHRLTFSPLLKRSLRSSTSLLLVVMALNGLAHVAQLLGAGYFAERLRELTVLLMAAGFSLTLVDEWGDFVDGANDNATAVACLLGLGAQLTQTPLQNTEVWLAFTGSEEVGLSGLRALLDKYSPDLRDAWFIDFEMVGAGEIAYVTRHSGLTFFNPYHPDGQSAALAAKIARERPELGASGQDVTIMEEVAILRRYGHRGICLVGLGEDGWLANWHQYSDVADNIDPVPLERAARFAWAMMREIDARP